MAAGERGWAGCIKNYDIQVMECMYVKKKSLWEREDEGGTS